MALKSENSIKRDDIEKVHLRFLKSIAGVLKQTSNIAVYGI